MRLKKIKLAGFKSFVDPTTIDFPSQLVGVVGPNGCGKSNVIDAVRWVMGESSAKHLRGTSLEDVIFSGSDRRKPVGRASVELVFDNRDGGLGGQYASYSEISVRRQLSRDGQSVYYLNGSRCRRRDITDIFLGTGLGPRSYAIIEQGTISRIIEARPEELRVFLEEAAGVSKYKDRRKETEARIRDTRDNIARLDDLIGEIDKRLQTLQRQARTAERYRSLREEARRYKAELLALRWQALDRRFGEQAAAVRALEVRLEERQASVRALEAEAERLREQAHEAGERLATAQADYYAAGADVARVEQLIRHHEERLATWRRDLDEVERQYREACRDDEGDRRLRSELEATIAESGPAIEAAQAAEQAAERALVKAEQALHAWQGRWEALNAELAVHRRRLEVEKTRIGHQGTVIDQLERRRGRLEAELAELAERRERDEVEGLEAECRRLEERRQDTAARLEGLRTSLEARREENRALHGRRRSLVDTLHRLHREQASLSALQSAALDKKDGGVADWLASEGLADGPTLAEVIEVEPGFERAVEAVLGGSLDALAVPDLEKAARALERLSSGHLTLIAAGAEAGRPAPPPGDGLSGLAGWVRAPWPIDHMLSGVYVADTLDQALAGREGLAPGQSIVTRDGVWLGKGWLRVERGDEEGGVLVREQRLKQLEDEIASLERTLAGLDEALQAGEREFGEMERRRDERQRELHDLTREETALQARLARQQATIEQAGRREGALRDELAELAQRYDEARTGLAEAERGRDAARAAIEARAGERQGLDGERDERRRAVDGARSELRQAQDRVRDLTSRLETARTRLHALDEAQKRSEQRRRQIAERRESLARRIDESGRPGRALADELQRHLERQASMQEALEEARRRLETIEAAIRETADRQRQAEQDHRSVRDELDAVRLAQQEAQVRRQTVLEQLAETGHDPASLLDALDGEAGEDAWQERLEAVEARIQRLGPINLAAIEEYEQESERRRYLDEQARDLDEALATLQRAIEKIDNETKSRFRETFEQVNERLADLYPRLFGGGMAKLEMIGDDLLDAGVAVVARPPGKRNSSIQQLSGGEKALTAAALVFALFELNPAPFCMLDEVDAPLDDSNAARLCRLVEAMSERVQFIYITHNKIAMEMADQLLGVTMFEPGVSRIVAVDVTEATELAATA